jgi:hypothetical protein
VADEHHETVKRAAALELGIEGIDDPEELRAAVEAKLASMDALARAAFEIRLGQIATEDAAGGPPTAKARIAVYVLVVVIAWLVWRPLAFAIAIFGLANARQVAIRQSLFWAPKGAVLFGTAYGLALGILVRFASVTAVHTTLGGVLFTVLGLFAAAYLGYGVETSPLLRRNEDEKRILAQVAAVVSYAFVLVGWFFVAALVRRG